MPIDTAKTSMLSAIDNKITSNMVDPA